MSIQILIPTPLRAYAGRLAKVEADASTVAGALNQLLAQHPSLHRHLFDAHGRLRNFVNVYLNDEDVRHLQGLETPVREGDTLTLVPSVAGGSGAGDEPADVPGTASNAPVANPAAATTKAEARATAPAAALSKEEIRRYSRHLIMPEVTLTGQARLKAGKVLLVGTGGLGSPMALYLAAAGVGTIGLVDFDVVDESNLQRQVIHGTKDVGRRKVESAAETLRDINPHVRVVTHETRLTSANALEIFEGYDVIADGTDNFPTRYLVNDACVLSKKPNVYGSIFRFEGQASVFGAPGGPCYRCLYPEPPPPGLVPSCAEGGVLGVLPGAIGLIQATEVLKLLMGIGEPLVGRLLLYDALAMTFRTLQIRRNAECPVCGDHPTVTSLIDYEDFCGIHEAELDPDEISLTATDLHNRLGSGETLVLLDVREPHEYEIVKLPGSRLIPLGELPSRASELDSAQTIVAYCHHGLRSAQATMFLRQAGFKRVLNLSGGIDGWAIQVEPEMVRY